MGAAPPLRAWLRIPVRRASAAPAPRHPHRSGSRLSLPNPDATVDLPVPIPPVSPISGIGSEEQWKNAQPRYRQPIRVLLRVPLPLSQLHTPRLQRPRHRRRRVLRHCRIRRPCSPSTLWIAAVLIIVVLVLSVCAIPGLLAFGSHAYVVAPPRRRRDPRNAPGIQLLRCRLPLPA